MRPSQAFYTIARRLFDPRFDSISPAGIAYCSSPHDVATCLAFVRKFKIPVSARCGGHSYAGYSTNSGGLVVDVSRMAGVGFLRDDGDGRRRAPGWSTSTTPWPPAAGPSPAGRARPWASPA